LVAAGANRNGFKLSKDTLEQIAIESPAPSRLRLRRSEVRQLLEEIRFTTRARARGEEGQAPSKEALEQKPEVRVLERRHPGLSRFRGTFSRWCKKAGNYLAVLHLTARVSTSRRAFY
jgi:hypothetical protein